MSTTYVITEFDYGMVRTQADRSRAGRGTPERYLTGFWLEDGRLTEVFPFSGDGSLLGNIYVGKVKNVLKNIEAAFVEIAGGQTCFLPLADAGHPILTNRAGDGRLHSGDEVLVQVKKDAVKTKDPVLSADLSLAGRYFAVFIGAGGGVRYSHKLSAEEKGRLRQALTEVSVPETMTLVVRTEAASQAADLLRREAKALLGKASRILEIGRTRTVFSLLSQQPPEYLAVLEEHAHRPDKIVTDDMEAYTAVSGWLAHDPGAGDGVRSEDGSGGAASSVHDAAPSECETAPSEHEALSGRKAAQPVSPALEFYRDPALSLAALYGLSGKLDEALSPRVWLKSGGYLVIEPTEAMTVIDVNTGKYTGRKCTEETFLRINEEAAEEVARQLRLRRLSGMILVDFINMERAENGERILSLLRRFCSRDPVPVRVVDMTPLGLVEITRQKRRKPLAEQLGALRRGQEDSR